ncbi:tRNA N6-adenosine threonylcarbamoyltransferase, mitochondrial isoform X1 [Bombyx mori]|uniref:N(6)-L-threonylcarbamoyladenine synthase n=1 Tax=Bombyx mori TaxID=7091 RepID=A0A8R2M5D8_BOMMO|nr:probable tRNA N6-adenosine threonylcarbamoyltransferase, mitochondrial [Bombyx mori]
MMPGILCRSAMNTFQKLRPLTNSKCNSTLIFGIETSCDDTGCAIINEEGNIIAESLKSQNLVHLRNGGIIPDVAQDLHRKYIEPTVTETLLKANLLMKDISAIAVTVKPGLPLSLAVGMKYAKHLARVNAKPIIPIHHMEAHALTVRMEHNVNFPYLVLLISGGHCLLAVVQNINKFLLLGKSIDMAPGELFDKIARRMKLRNVPELSTMCGGQAVETAALRATNPEMFNLPIPLVQVKDCNFSFNGLKTSVLYHLRKKEKEHKVVADALIPEISNLCCAALIATTKHLVHRTQRAMQFCSINNLIPENNKRLVVSGGVACNNYIFNALKAASVDYGYNVYRPSMKLCTDNGIMIAWNGLEKWRKNLDIMTNFNTLDLEATSQLGESLIDQVASAKIKTKIFKFQKAVQ